MRDGLKPVHRRILYGMSVMRLDPGTAFKKSARVVGDVMGKYHPHGDSAIYDAMARLAQDFAVRYPMVDGQGNFGSIDGDNPAAMRYTEARLTAAAALMLDGLDEDTVDFRPNYDGTEQEPSVLPAAFPNLLANGATGIAVGMATNIPPHNVAEICDALSHLLKFPNARVDKLVDFIKGPDFPTGGTVVESRDTIVEAYKTGRGSFRIRAKWEKEELKGGTYQVVRKISMHLETWDADPVGDQERIFGRTKQEGAPLSGAAEKDTPDFHATSAAGGTTIDPRSHIALAAHENNGGVRILRRSYNYTDGINQYGVLDAGLLFISYQNDPAHFEHLQTKLGAADLLNEYITHIGSAIFFVPPAPQEGSYIAAQMFADG